MSIRKGSVYIAGNNISIDGDTISYNSNNSLQSVGNINKNVAVGSVDKLFDWVGTNADYIAQDIETLHPEWICYITDDQGTGVGAVYNTAQADARFFKKNDDTDSITISGLGMPDFMHVEEITILAVGAEYTAPANGWFICTGISGSGNVGTIQIRSTVNPTLPDMRISSWATGASNRACGVIFPTKAGDTIAMYYGSYTNDKHFYFIYTEGNPTNS